MHGGDLPRRRLLAAAGLASALAGCAGVIDDGNGESADAEPTERDDADTEAAFTDGEITAFEVTPGDPLQGQEVTVTATVSNTGDTAQSGVLEVAFDGQTVFTDPVSLAAGGSDTFSFSVERWQDRTQEAVAVLSDDGEVDTARATVDVRPRHEAFVGVAGTDLVIDGETVFYGGAHGGGNLHSRTSSDDVGGFEYTYDDVYDGEHYVADFMRYAAAIDTPVIRTTAAAVDWATNSTVHDGPGEFNEAWFELFDTVVAEAKRNGIRLVVSLLSHDDELAPAPAAYARWSDTVEDNLDRDSLNDAFFHDEQANEYHRNFIEKLLTRENHITGVEYRNDPTIMMWECGNEIEYWHWDRRGESLAEWYDDVAKYIKSIDDNHLVGSGMYVSDERNEFVADHRSDAIDVCSFHLYPKYPNRTDIAEKPYEEEPVTDMSVEETVDYIEGKVETAHDELGKPVVLGEFGVPQFPDIYGWDLEKRRRYFEAMYEVADRTDLNGVHAFALTLDKKYTGEVRITDGRAENGIYPHDDLGSIISRYSETAAEKSDASITE